MCINLLPLESFINASFQRIYVVRRNANAFNEVFDRLIKFFLISSKIVTTMVAVIGREVFAVSAARGTTIKWLSAFRTHDDPFVWKFGVFHTFFYQVFRRLAFMYPYAILIFSNDKLTSICSVE